MTNLDLTIRLRGVADRLAAVPVQIEDANVVRLAADALEGCRAEVVADICSTLRSTYVSPDHTEPWVWLADFIERRERLLDGR